MILPKKEKNKRRRGIFIIERANKKCPQGEVVKEY